MKRFTCKFGITDTDKMSKQIFHKYNPRYQASEYKLNWDGSLSISYHLLNLGYASWGLHIHTYVCAYLSKFTSQLESIEEKQLPSQ